MRMFKAVRNSMDNPWWKVPVTENDKLVYNAKISDGESAEDANSRTWNASTAYRLLAPRTCLRQDGTLCLFFTPTTLRLLLLSSGCEVVHASLCCVNPPPGQHRIYINARGIRKSRPNDWLMNRCHCRSFILHSSTDSPYLPKRMYSRPGWCYTPAGQGQVWVNWMGGAKQNPIDFFKIFRRKEGILLSSLKDTGGRHSRILSKIYIYTF